MRRANSNSNSTKAAVIALATLLTTMCSAQRPMYAGSRPGGLSQKDKYRPTANATVDVVNRFGASQDPAVNTIPYGAEQQPPAVGLPVVMPESSYQPLPSTAGVASTTAEVGNRFGGGNTGGPINGVATPNQPIAPTQPLPLDAHGDRVLLEQLARLPVEKRPFWYLNYMAIEAQRNSTTASLGVPANHRGSFAGSRSSSFAG